MRLAALALAAASTAAGTAAVATLCVGTARAEYFCSPGFEPSYGGTCVAVAARAEIEQFIDQPLLGTEETVVRTYRHHHRRHGLRERY